MCFWSLVPLRTPELSLTSRSPTNILVSWQPLPPKLSRGRVSAYRLSYRTATDEQLISVELPVPSENCTQYLLQGLQPDTIYLIRMSASTRVGWSQPSAWSSHRTPKTSSATGERLRARLPSFGSETLVLWYYTLKKNRGFLQRRSKCDSGPQNQRVNK